MIKILTMIMTGNVKQNGSRMDTRGRHGGKYKRMQPYEMYYVNFCHFANLTRCILAKFGLISELVAQVSR